MGCTMPVKRFRLSRDADQLPMISEEMTGDMTP